MKTNKTDQDQIYDSNGFPVTPLSTDNTGKKPKRRQKTKAMQDRKRPDFWIDSATN